MCKRVIFHRLCLYGRHNAQCPAGHRHKNAGSENSLYPIKNTGSDACNARVPSGIGRDDDCSIASKFIRRIDNNNMIYRQKIILTGIATSLIILGMMTSSLAQDPQKPAPPEGPETPAASAPAALAAPKKANPEPGSISRSTGHLFREGLAAGISAEGVQKTSLSKSNDKGLLTNKADGAFPAGQLWAGTSAEEIIALLSALTPNPDFETGNELARRILLTDAPWPESDTLKALRLQKMIEFGAGQQAGKLYSSWAPEKPDLPLLKAGVTALLISGHPSVACLELGAQKAKWDQNTDPFFKTISDNCKVYIKKGANDPVAFISAGPPDWQDHLSLYADKGGRSDSLAGKALHLYAEARAGSTSKDLIDRYTAIFPQLPNRTRVAFAPVLSHIPLSALTTDEQKVAFISTFIAGNNPKGVEWTKSLSDLQDEKPVHNPKRGALALAALIQENPQETGVIPVSFNTLARDKNVNLGKIFKFLSEMLDTAPRFIDTPGVVYEKKRDLTSAYNYVMPWKVLQNHFKQARESGSIGRMVLASLLIIQASPSGTPDPEAVKLVVQGWKHAGLKEEVRHYATSVLLGVNEIGDK